MPDRSGIDRRTTEHCDMHIANSEQIIDNSATLAQIKGGLIVASALLGFVMAICGGMVTYYVGQMSDTVKTLSTDMKEIHTLVHENQMITMSNSAALVNLETDIKQFAQKK